MTLENLLEKLGFDDSLSKAIISTDDGIGDKEFTSFARALTDKNEYENAEKRLIARLLPDERGIKALKVMLKTSLYSYKLYEQKGISSDVFFATMKCFKRFCDESKKEKGCYVFDRSFWVGRQLSLSLFRLGELEYELYSDEKVKDVALHVPSDADLSPEKIDASLCFANEFIKEHSPDFYGARYVMTSWLLSPILPTLLPENSKIVKFSERFNLLETKPSDEYKFWVYGDSNAKPEDFPENTRLQRSLKEYVLAGNTFLEGFGELKR